MKWVLVLILYGGPPDAVDYDGPWQASLVQSADELMDTEAQCRTRAIQTIGSIHDKGLLAPIRYHCVPVEAGLPAGAPR